MHARTRDVKATAGTPGGARGFTLIELAVALFIIVLVLGSLLVPLATQVEQRQVHPDGTLHASWEPLASPVGLTPGEAGRHRVRAVLDSRAPIA